MLNKKSLQNILDRLQSPTHGALSSELQLAALQGPESPSSHIHVSFDKLEAAHVVTLQNTIQQLDEDAATILALHAVLQNRMQTAKICYQSATAALAPINRFPAEVLARIFVAGKHFEINFCLRVSWVTKRWRSIAISTPELWSRIPLTDLARVSVYLERSGTTPLDIEVDVRTYRVTTFTLRRSMELLEPHIHRWRDVKVLLEEHEQAQLVIRPLEDLCRRISEGSFDGQISAIRFGVPFSPGLISDTYNSFLSIPPTATLRAIELLDVNLICVPATAFSMFRQMHTLSLSSVENMHLDTHLFSALSSMPSLSSLILDQCIFVIAELDADLSPEITLTNLMTLELSYIADETANLIFLRLYAPNLQTLGWHPRALEGPSHILNWAAIRVRYISLSVLKLRNVTSYATNHLLRWLEDLPNLISLTIIFGERLSPQRVAQSANEILQLLSKTRSSCCARLARLTIGDLDEKNLVQLQAAIQAKAGLRTGKVAVVLQPATRELKGRKEFMEWVNANNLNVKIYEFSRGGTASENDGEEIEDSDDE